MRRCAAELLFLSLFSMTGCDVEGTIGLGFDPNHSLATRVGLSFTPHQNIDILFVIDNTANMGPKQQALKGSLEVFAGQLAQLDPRHFHFGVVTTDLGAGPPQGSCVRPGDDGLLLPLGRDAPADCQPPVSSRFLDFDQAGDNNLPPGQSLAQTLGCMVQVGTRGCAYRQPLEALLRSLKNRENDGFLRDDSLFLTVILSDGDDCSAPPDSPVFAAPVDPLRCVMAGVECGNPPQPLDSGVHNDCQPRSGGGLYDLSRYQDFLFRANGVRSDPNAFGMVFLNGPPFPVTLTPGNQLQPSCVASDDARYQAMPGVRLHGLAGFTPKKVISNLCMPAASEYALGSLVVNLITPDPGAPCLPGPLADGNQPQCDVLVGGEAIADCASTGGSPNTRCWDLRDEPSCVPFLDPHSRREESLALEVRPPVPRNGLIEASCMVIEPLK